jgi:esterase/lipase
MVSRIPVRPTIRGIATLSAATLTFLGLVYVLGPRARVSGSWEEPVPPSDVVAHVRRLEAAVPAVRPGDQEEIVWAAESEGSPTPVSLVYLHGFSADRHEVEPLITLIARDLGANVYFARLKGHGRDGEAMGQARAEDWLEDALEAVAIGGRIGGRVVLIGTSTGGTLATWAATRPEVKPRLGALLLVSPNFRVKDRSSRVLLWPWGGLIARAILGPERCFEAENLEQERHWTTCYPTSALLPMMALVEHVRTSDLGGIETPVFLAYSPEDQVVDPSETERLFPTFGSSSKVLHVVRDVGDPASHVLAGDILSPATTDGLALEMLGFLSGLGLTR